MRATVADGWLIIPYDGHDVALAEIGVGEPADWKPAFLDFYMNQRVAKIRPPEDVSRTTVRLRINGTVTVTEQLVV